jgi:CRISPR/Cas system CSM-associated protein Csm3 (group 7 of RAMP superfamily)
MKVDFECFVPGTKFYHWFALEYPNDIELSCFAHAMELFKSSPYVGGKSGTGHGEIEFHYEGLEELDPSAYLQFLEDKKDEIVQLLKEIEKAL